VERIKISVVNHHLIEFAFEDLCHSLRVLLEADARANKQGLLFIDRAEAVGNIENALSSVLNAFHSFYDAVKKELGKQPIDWYRTGALAIVLAIRNARHHNKASKIRTLYTYHIHESARPDRMQQYILIDFPSPEEGADTFDLYMSWADLQQFLILPCSESKIPLETGNTIRLYLNSDKFGSYASNYKLSESRVFFNIIPLLVNAGATVIPSIKKNIRGISQESKFFLDHFTTLEQADTKNHEVHCGPFVLPE
jgi:hypothetical protein